MLKASSSKKGMINCFCTKECDFGIPFLPMLFMSIETMKRPVVFTFYYGLIDLQSQLSSDPLNRRSALSLYFFYIFTIERYVCIRPRMYSSMYCISIILPIQTLRTWHSQLPLNSDRSKTYPSFYYRHVITPFILTTY